MKEQIKLTREREAWLGVNSTPLFSYVIYLGVGINLHPKGAVLSVPLQGKSL